MNNIFKHNNKQSNYLRWLRPINAGIALVMAIVTQCLYANNTILFNVYTETNALNECIYVDNNGNESSRLSIDSCNNELSIDRYEIPTKIIHFAVPTYSKNFRVEVLNPGTFSLRKLKRPSYVVPNSIPTSINSSHRPIKMDEGISSESARIIGETYLDGWAHVISVAVPIVEFLSDWQYKFYNNIQIAVSYDLCAPDDLEYSPLLVKRGSAEHISKIVVNPNELDDKIAINNGPIKAAYTKKRQYYYIIVPNNLADAVSDLARWKRQKGYEVIVTNIESILSHPTHRIGARAEIVDEAASLRSYLIEQRNKIRDNYYCLLIGDYKTTMPIRKATRGTNPYYSLSENPNGEYFIPTDNYFSDLTSPYELTKYTFSDGESLYCYNLYDYQYTPELYLGRLLCSTPSEIMNYTIKLINYESNPGYGNPEYLNRATAFFHNQMYKANELSWAFDNFQDKNFYHNLDAIVDTVGNYPLGRDVISSMRFSGFSSWHGHGNPGNIITSDGSFSNGNFISAMDYYDTKDHELPKSYGNGINNLSNDGYPFVAYSISCTIMPFDKFKYNNGSQHTFDIPYNFGSAFTTSGLYGGVALLSNTRNGYVEASSILESQFAKSIIEERHIGIAQNKSKTAFIEYDIPDTISLIYSLDISKKNYLITTHNLIGDPEFEMWLQSPEHFRQFNIELSNGSLNIASSDLSGSYLSVCTGDDYLTNDRFILSSNSESFGLSTHGITPNCILASIWKTGFLPKTILLFREGVVTDIDKKFVFCDASIETKNINSSDGKVILGDNTNLSIKAIHSVTSNREIHIQNNATVSIDCDGNIDLSNLIVESGGTLNLIGKRISLGIGFKVKNGGTLNVSYKN